MKKLLQCVSTIWTEHWTVPVDPPPPLWPFGIYPPMIKLLSYCSIMFMVSALPLKLHKQPNMNVYKQAWINNYSRLPRVGYSQNLCPDVRTMILNHPGAQAGLDQTVLKPHPISVSDWLTSSRESRPPGSDLLLIKRWNRAACGQYVNTRHDRSRQTLFWYAYNTHLTLLTVTWGVGRQWLSEKVMLVFVYHNSFERLRHA